jgi:hypothetical protein
MTYLGLELDIRCNARLLALGRASVPELDDHLTEQNPSSVHVRHRNHVGW